MAGKSRRTKRKDRDESSDDSNDSEDEHPTKKFRNISFVKREKTRELARTKKKLSKLCDSEGSSDSNQKKSRPIARLPIAVKKKPSLYKEYSSTEVTDSDSVKSKPTKSSKSKSSPKSKKKRSTSPSGSDSGIKKSEDTLNKNSSSTKKASASKAKKQHVSSSSSGDEFQNSKLKTVEKPKITGKRILADTSLLETPSKSDEESIPLSEREVIRVKAMVIERGDTIKKICKDLEDDLEHQSQYYTKKKISVLRDAKFMAHKVIEMYKNSIDKLKKDASDFRNNYQSFVDSFKEKNSNFNRSLSKNLTPRSFHINSESSDSSESDSLKKRNSKHKNKTNQSCSKLEISHSNKSLLQSPLQNSTPNRVKRKNSSQDNLVTPNPHSSLAKKSDLNDGQKSSDEDDHMHSVETVKLNTSFDTLQNNKTDKNLSVKSFLENDDSQEKDDLVDDQRSSPALPTDRNDDLIPSTNEAESPKQNPPVPDVADESSRESTPKDPTKDPLELESSNSNAPVDSAQDNLVEKSSPPKKRANLSLSRSSKETNKSTNKAIYSSDSDEPGLRNVVSGSPRDRNTSDVEKKSEPNKSKLNLSLKSSRNGPPKPSSEKESANESSGEVSDCDSDRIFSDKETGKKKSQKKKRRSNHSESSAEEEVDKMNVNDSSTSKMESRRKSNAAVASDSDDLFDSTTSEVPNTPVKSPVSTSKSLRKTLLLATMTARISDVDSEPELPDETVKSPAINEDMQTEPEPAATEPDAEDEIDVEEKRALKSLLQDIDSDESSSRSNDSDVESVVSKCSDRGVKKKLLKKNRELLMQTKKRNSISSDSSSSHSADEAKNNSSDSDSLAPKKRRRLDSILRKCRHYKSDKKLRMVCRVKLQRLSQQILDKHSRALEKSKRYVANKVIKSATNLDGIEGKKRNRKNADKVGPKKKKRVLRKKSEEQSDGDEHLESDKEALNNGKSDEKKEFGSKNNLDEGTDAVDSEAEAKKALLNACTSSSDENENDKSDVEDTGKSKNSKKKSSAKEKDAVISVSDEEKKIDKAPAKEKEKKKKSDWKDDKILKFKITDSESEEEKFVKSQEKKKAKQSKEKDKSSDEDVVEIKSPTDSPIKKPRKQRKKRVLDSDSDVKVSSDEESVVSVPSESEEEMKEAKKKKRTRKRKKSSDSDSTSSNDEKQKKSKRKRIKKVASDSESDDQESPGKGRKNIRKVLKDKHVTDDTKRAAQDEEERLKRIAERQKLFNEMYDAKVAGEAKVEKLVLDFDEETKEELVVVHKELVKRLKPHQAEGIKFMWTACFESLKQIEESEGSGCIIAHCMGLGKTFQVVTLAHTLLSNEKTGVRTVMIVCPLSTVLNWVNEFKMWLKHVKDEDEIEIYELTKMKKNIERKYQLESWQKTGGVMIIGYEMFRNLTSTGKKMRKAMQESILRSLVDPGADLVVCDEGHLLKNEDSALSKAMKLVKTRRRIVLTGTPLQNNLKEYHCMVQFVKPNLLGTKKEFLNRFVNPISNGQFDDSTPYDVKLMKKRAHVLHKMLEPSVQRFDYSVLTPFLPPKQEYVIFVRLTEVQIKMYQHYLDNFARRYGGRNGSLFADFQELQRIWTHPYVLRLNAAKVDRVNEKKRLEASDSEGSLKDFIDDDSESDAVSTSDAASGSGSDVQCIDSDGEKPAPKTRSTRLNPKDEPEEVPAAPVTTEESSWWSKYLEEKHFEDMRISTKLLLLFGILRESEQIGDKVLVFSQSLYSLTLIEQFLNLIDQQTQEGGQSEFLDGHTGTWALGLDYFRLDGSTSAENRSAWCKIFNNPSNTRARLFLISTRAGGLGINLTAANRVIIFDASWNPSHDVQSIFRIYRFGQKKPCYVYRFLAAGTMEEKIYNRQVTKLSLACRVVDEQQIERHYSNNDLAELYQFESYEDQSVTLALPKDRLLAEIFLKYKDSVYNYHEHDSLLENKEEEELDEEERKQAWQEYEEERQGKRQMVNMGMNMGANNMLGLMMNSFPEMESIKLLIQKDYPNLPPEHLETVARQAIYDMYRYVDQQAVNQTLNSFVGQNNMYGGQMQQYNTPLMNQQQQQMQLQNQLMNMNQPLMNYPGVNQMPVYSGRGRPPKQLSMHNQMMNISQMQNSIATPAPMRNIRINDDVEVTDPLALSSNTLSGVNNANDANDDEEE